METITYTNIQNLAVAALLVLLTVLILPAIRTWLQQRIGVEKAALLTRFIADLVQAAEQLHGSAGESVNQLKKTYVFEGVKRFAAQHGITITDDQINALIEAAVFQLKEWARPRVSN